MDLTRSESHGWRKQREKQHYGVAMISMQPWPGLISNQYADLFAGVGVVCRLFLALLQRQGRRAELSFCKLIQCVLVLMFVL